jgi:23S rRNA (uracil1939-C5)-methyltransferase
MKSSRKKHRRFKPSFAAQVRMDTKNPVVNAKLTGFNNHGDATGITEDGENIDVAFGIPEEDVQVEILGRREGTLYGRVVKINSASSSRKEPECPHFGQCGGCQLQHIDYDKQLQLKRDIVIKSLREIAQIIDPAVSQMIKSPLNWGYRNNARFTVRNDGEIGFTNWITHQFESIKYCHIMDPRINEIKNQLKDSLNSSDSQLSVRVGANTDSYMIQPNLSDRDIPLNFETGQPQHSEKLLGFNFQVSSPSFFQVNTRQAEKMVNLIREKLNPNGLETLVDAYAGVGVFAGLLSPYYANIIAVEESAAAVKDAKQNLLGLSNIDLIQEKTELVMQNENFIIDHLILDPPRSGCDQSVLDSIIENKPEKVAYVSCDPITLSRDLSYLVLGGFSIKEVIPIDMFPQTYHIESLTILERPTRQSYILASTSKRRIELLQSANFKGTILGPTLKEELFSNTLPSNISPSNYATEIALAKVKSIGNKSKIPVLAADTIVVSSNGEILGKPKDAKDARKMLYTLRGDVHEVITAVALINPISQEIYSNSTTTTVTFRDCSDKEIEDYIIAGNPYEKAGGYGIQDKELNPVEMYHGCPLNILGLPLCSVQQLFGNIGMNPFRPIYHQTGKFLHQNCTKIFSRWMDSL